MPTVVASNGQSRITGAMLGGTIGEGGLGGYAHGDGDRNIRLRQPLSRRTVERMKSLSEGKEGSKKGAKETSNHPWLDPSPLSSLLHPRISPTHLIPSVVYHRGTPKMILAVMSRFSVWFVPVLGTALTHQWTALRRLPSQLFPHG